MNNLLQVKSELLLDYWGAEDALELTEQSPPMVFEWMYHALNQDFLGFKIERNDLKNKDNSIRLIQERNLLEFEDEIESTGLRKAIFVRIESSTEPEKPQFPTRVSLYSSDESGEYRLGHEQEIPFEAHFTLSTLSRSAVEYLISRLIGSNPVRSVTEFLDLMGSEDHHPLKEVMADIFGKLGVGMESQSFLYSNSSGEQNSSYKSGKKADFVF